ncbi:hypothetical protein LWM68_23840 [Niabella sp. W65]|nr:hypothetical protein [Niabella sp. W65]MCH7365535.1 hypothetical protein [Niabella sp. W65]
MKRLYKFAFLLILITATAGAGAQVYVSPDGNDVNAGTKEHPKLTLQAALRQVRELRRLNDAATGGPIHIIMQEGIYRMQEPVFVRAEDAGTTQSPTYIEAAPGAKVTLSGGIMITGWKKRMDQRRICLPPHNQMYGKLLYQKLLTELPVSVSSG